jgi:hypothetical protein
MANSIPFNKLEVGKKYTFSTNYRGPIPVTIRSIQRIGPSVRTVEQVGPNSVIEHVSTTQHHPKYTMLARGGKRTTRRRHRKRQTRRASK